MGVQSWTHVSGWVLEAHLQCILDPRQTTSNCTKTHVSSEDPHFIIPSMSYPECTFKLNNIFYSFPIKWICCSSCLPFQQLFCNWLKHLPVALSAYMNSFLIVVFNVILFSIFIKMTSALWPSVIANTIPKWVVPNVILCIPALFCAFGLSNKSGRACECDITLVGTFWRCFLCNRRAQLWLSYYKRPLISGCVERLRFGGGMEQDLNEQHVCRMWHKSKINWAAPITHCLWSNVVDSTNAWNCLFKSKNIWKTDSPYMI